MTAGHLYVVELGRDQLTICNSQSGVPLVLKFPPSSVADLEVTNPTDLENQIKTAITQAQLPPSPLIIIISASAYFEMDLTGVDKDAEGEKIQAFLDAVPLKSLSYRVFKVGTSQRLVAINRHTYELVKQAFEKLGFSVTAVTVEAILPDIKVTGQLSAQSCRLILNKVEYIKQNSFSSEPPAVDFKQKRQRFVQSHQTTLVLVSVMFIAFGIAMSVILTRRSTNPPVSAAGITPRPARLSPSPSTNPDQLSVMLVDSSAAATAAAAIQLQLQSLGLTRIQTASAAATSNQTLLVFSPRVNLSLRDALVAKIKTIYPALGATENSAAQYDITITLGQFTP